LALRRVSHASVSEKPSAANTTPAIDVQVVYVGKNPVNDAVGTKYWPEKITAAPGTMVQFQFWAGNHTVTQSNFDNPCKPITQNANGTSVSPIKSGFMPVEESADIGQIPIYTIMINDTSPLWFYCGQGPHCANGMSLVINEK
jgi:plastocyanin